MTNQHTTTMSEDKTLLILRDQLNDALEQNEALQRDAELQRIENLGLQDIVKRLAALKDHPDTVTREKQHITGCCIPKDDPHQQAINAHHANEKAKTEQMCDDLQAKLQQGIEELKGRKECHLKNAVAGIDAWFQKELGWTRGPDLDEVITGLLGEDSPTDATDEDTRETEEFMGRAGIPLED